MVVLMHRAVKHVLAEAKNWSDLGTISVSLVIQTSQSVVILCPACAGQCKKAIFHKATRHGLHLADYRIDIGFKFFKSGPGQGEVSTLNGNTAFPFLVG